MLLSSIQVQGFKSFADKTVLKFGKGITAIVGPNGSGKSNISDAVRWVLGEQSTKNLRGQSMEDVIFDGTELRKPHGFCEVTLNIDNSDRSLNYDNDFVSITRRFYRSHESDFSINGVSVRLKDIHELFMDTGLGRDGYSMIGQGKIDNIISSKSGERRDIFEEAAGISKYRYRRIEAERKLSAAEENLLRLHDILDELESRVGPLKEQSRKAEKFLKLSADKRELEIGLWLYTLANSKEAIKAQENKISRAEIEYREIEKELEEFDRQTQENSDLFARLTSEIEGERLNISSYNQEIVKSGGDISVLENSIAHNNEVIERLQTEKLSLIKTDDEAALEIADNDKSIEAKSVMKIDFETKLSALEGSITELLSDSETISYKIEAQIKNLNSISMLASDLRVEAVTAQTSIEEITKRSASFGEKKSELNSESEKLNSDFKETESLLKGLDESIESSKNMLDGYRITLASAESKASELKAECDEIRLTVEEKKRRIQILTDLEKNMEGFGYAVKSVMAQKEKGLLKGICGPVSKLINVDRKYSIAIETALGNSMQNIITETENDAKRAIAFLKSNNFGRATFLPINTIKAREFKESGFDGMFGFVGIASDLVDTDTKYREIINYLLSGTVVAEEIDEAITIAKKFNYRFKVVTLDGQVVNPGGSLTGGSLAKNSGILNRASDIKQYEAEIEKLNKKFEKSNEEYEQAIAKQSKISAELTAVQAEMTTFNEDKIRALAELRRIDDLRNNVKSALETLETENSENTAKIAEFNKKYNDSLAQISELELKKSKVQAEIDEMTGGRDTINSKRESVMSEITDLKLKIIEIQKDIQSLNLNKERIESMISSRELRASDIESELAGLGVANEDLKEKIGLINAFILGLQEKIKDTENKISDMIERRNMTEQSGVSLRSSERENTLKREKIGGELARLTERKEVMLKEYDEVIAKLYDEYELTRSEAESLGIEIEKPSEAKKKLAEIKNSIRSLGSVNVSAIEEYKEVSERYEFLLAQINDVETSRAELHKLINQLTSQMKEIFSVGFAKISENFSKTFLELFGGGTASLTLSDPENILESGIDINVKLPGKNVPSIEGLSGGEKALIALAIYFAIMRVSAPPFCFLDEVDTALDDINVERFAEFMKNSGFATQFICVTHRRGTMEAADMLYGVTMQEKGVTKLLELNVSQLEKELLKDNNIA